MEISVRKADLVKELQLVQGIVERKNSIPILSNVLAEAKGGELRISATDLDVSLRGGCAAEVKGEGRHHPGRQEAVRDRALAARGRRPHQDAARRLGARWTASRCASRWPGCPRRTSRRCPRARPRAGSTLPASVAQGPDRAHGLRHHGRGRALLPGRRAHGAGQGRRGPGGHRRPSARVRAPQGPAQGRRAAAGPGPAQGDPGDRRACWRTEEEAQFQQADNHLVFTVGRPHAGLEDDRGAVPRLREGDRGRRRQAADARPGARWPPPSGA